MLWPPDTAEGFRWLQNNPAISLFELVFKPLAVGVFASVFPDKDFTDGYREIKGFALFLLLILGALSVGLVIQDASSAINDRIVAPYDFPKKYQKDFLKLDTELRKKVKDENEHMKQAAEGGKPADKVLKVECISAGSPGIRLGAAECYKMQTKDKIGHLKLELGLFKGIGPAALWSRFFTFTSVAFIALTFWYLLVIAYSRKSLAPTSFESLLLTYGFIIAWFPLRMYSEWYINYGRLDLNNYPAFYFAALFAVLFLGLLFLMNTKNVLVNSLVGGISGLSIVFAVIAKFDESMFNSIANLYNKIEGTSFIGLIFILAVVLLACLVYYGKDFLHAQKPDY